MQKSKFKANRIHDFRHNCASMLINMGANITVVASYLGHSDIKVTLDTYSHMYKPKLDDISTLINNLK
ncbi:MAG: tyrosine-type recombinase/integrase [Bacilli bacterium]